MQVIYSPEQLRNAVTDQRRLGKRIGLVATMGGLHEGHLSLLRQARKQCDVLVMSLFVNPTQFGPSEDLDRYPRSQEQDIESAKACGVDFVFVPDVACMYPNGFQTTIRLTELTKTLCGADRPGHFEGVATVVTKLFHLARPDVAIFGQKDAQQLAVIRQLVLDLDFGIEIVAAPIVREADGLAMSSRNAYLSDEERKQAISLSQGLRAAEQRFSEGAIDEATLVGAVTAVIGAQPLARIEYVELRDATTLVEVSAVHAPALLALATTFGQTRLIDNIVLTPSA